MPGDYIPAADPSFHVWQANFHSYLSSNFAALGLVIGDVTPITGAKATWELAFADHAAAQAAAQSATAAKNGARASYVALIRPLVNRLQASPDVDEAEKAALGITVGDTKPTPTGPPASRPVVRVECGQRLQHTIHFSDEATPTKKAKPPGVLGAEIWVAIVPIGQPTPTDPEDFSFVALDTATPYTLDFDGPDGGKNAHYILRWVNSTGEKGPWSETASVTIGA